MAAAVTGYDISVWIHVTAAVVGLGAAFGQSLFFGVAMRMGARYLPLVHQLRIAINRYLATPALLVLLITGFYQVSEGNWSFGDAWISATFVILLALGGLLGGYFIPTDKRLRAMAEEEIAAAGAGEVTLSERYRRAAQTAETLSGLTGLLVIVALFLMVVKPGV